MRRTQEGYFFNHGLQFLRLDSPKVSSLAAEWERAGALMEWTGRHGRLDASTGNFTPRSDCEPGAHPGFCSFLEPGKLYVNGGLTEHLRRKNEPGVRVELGCKVSAIDGSGGEGGAAGPWRLRGSKFGEPVHTFGDFDAVVFTDAMAGRKGSPGHVLLNGEVELGSLFPVLDEVRVKPVFSLMVAYARGDVSCDFDAASVVGSEAFQFVSAENAKPNYDAVGVDCDSFVALSTFERAEDLLERHPQQKNFKFVEQTKDYLDPIQADLLADFESLLGCEGKVPVYAKAQRWGGAFYSSGCGGVSRDLKSYVDEGRMIALCGDYCCETSTAENAVLSGLDAAERLAGMLP